MDFEKITNAADLEASTEPTDGRQPGSVMGTVIRQEQPKSPSQDLREQLKDAVAREDFERAAVLRDRIQALDYKRRTRESKSVDNV